MIDRRTFLGALSGSLLAAPRAAEAQQAGRLYQVGIVSLGSAMPSDLRGTIWWRPLIEELRELNYVQGRNLVIKYFGAEAKPERLPGFAADLVKAKVDVIVTTGPRETLAAKRATSSIPIVFTLVQEPVRQGIVTNLARPEGNVTGLTPLVPGLYQKYVELLHQMVPSAKRFALVAGLAPAPEFRQELVNAGRTLGVDVLIVHISGPDEFDAALARTRRDGAAGIIVIADVLTQIHHQRFVQAALKHGLPGIFWERGYVEAGGLMTYSVNYPELLRRAAQYVDRILKGAKPGDLPVEQPTKFDLLINLKTAKALGLTVPPALLQRADRVIE